jgi:hypothetical protein
MEKDIGKIPKNDTTNIILRIDDFADRRGLTIREFVESERYTGFTKAGVRIMAKDFKAFKDMINSIPEEDMKELESSEQPAESQKPKDQKTLTDSSKKEPLDVPSDEEIGDF